MPQNKQSNKKINDENDTTHNKIVKRKKVKTSIKKRKAKSLTNIKSSIKKNKNKNKVHKFSKGNTNKRKSKSLTILHNKQNGGYSETTDSELCSKNINDVLSTNKKIFTYNQPDKNQYAKMEKDASVAGDMAKNGWGNYPGPPPDPKKCVIK